MSRNIPGRSQESLTRSKDRRNERARQRTKTKTLETRSAIPFIAIDGEGTAAPASPERQVYSILSASTGDTLRREDGLGFWKIAEWLLNLSTANPSAHFCVYGASYDWNMWTHALGKTKATQIYKAGKFGEFVDIGRGTHVRWIPGKTFEIREDGATHGAFLKRSILIYDVFPFFQCSFVKACDEYLHADPYWIQHREAVIAGKNRRAEFTWAEATSISAYNDHELVLLINLMDTLRSSLFTAELYPKRWDGPGAIASALLTRENIPAHMNREIPVPVADATRVAYTGGRAQVFQIGTHRYPSYQYDLNSAYPAALKNVPCLNPAHGEWIETGVALDPDAFGVVKISFTIPDSETARYPGPLYVRASNGALWYPPRGTGWYWNAEAAAARDYLESLDRPTSFTIHEGYTWKHYNPDRCECDAPYPFAFISEEYLQRQEWKAEGNPAEKGLKLGLNSLYGKLAQQVGWGRTKTGVHGQGNLAANHVTRTGENVRIPPFHQIEWAGYTTAHTRAQLLRAIMLNPGAVIATATDAVFTTRPLDLDIGKGLGQWSESRYWMLAFRSSGMYAYSDDTLTCTVKERGIIRGTMAWQDFQAAWEHNTPTITSTNHFVTLGEALTGDNYKRWCRWETREKSIAVVPTSGKMVWNESEYTNKDVRRLRHTLLPLIPSIQLSCAREYTSYPHVVAWENPSLADRKDWVTADEAARPAGDPESDYPTQGVLW